MTAVLIKQQTAGTVEGAMTAVKAIDGFLLINSRRRRKVAEVKNRISAFVNKRIYFRTWRRSSAMTTTEQWSL